MAVLVNPSYNLKTTSLVDCNKILMSNTIFKFVQMVYECSETLKIFNTQLKQFEKTNFVSSDFRKLFLDAKCHFTLKTFCKELTVVFENYKPSATKQSCFDMTLYQLVPMELHSTFFFKLMQSVMKAYSSTQADLHHFKYALFMMLHVESSV